MTKEEFESRFYEIVDPYVKSYNQATILSWVGTHIVPKEFMEHLPEGVRSQIRTWLASVEES